MREPQHPKRVAHEAASSVLAALALEVLAHPDVGPLIWGRWSVRKTRRLSRTCKALHALRRDQLAKWGAQLREARGPRLACIETMCQLAERGHLALIKWLRAKGCPWDATACSGAAGGGHLEVLQYLHSKKCPWDWWACYGAAESGHLNVLQWLHAKGCPWDATACAGAVKGDHLEVLQWLRANGCPWDKWACVRAATRKNRIAVLKWLLAQRD